MIRRTERRIRLCAALLAANLLFIWGNSLLPASVSGQLSQWIADLLQWFMPSEGAPIEGEGILRKVAHFLEFCSLGFLLNFLIEMMVVKVCTSAGLALAGGLAVACIDEMLQHFAPGRAPSLRDVGIDTAGVAAGICLLWAGCFLIQKCKLKLSGGKDREKDFFHGNCGSNGADDGSLRRE